ncbi:putative ADP-heptose synthase [Prochlorococcus marinus subsp. pastoris str. CCMP1986]|uniref:Putative ADP-heptose synthase n=1 Tax=Prochlorococcus marinus subsp. pastoris (strain CCMP1986 / NIES-2087 / MED4) TaxID=59919 RepID=Q7V0N8_PROMP|nr:PfkB family carbohydrate kinase [Prochlorococcus marinus]KGF87221.1 ADP-heptose synthase [Prochlorococcus marinus str. EQPAC1]CAE19677.1 putative ADP-heptose synthase [Prochlorococcus marinus subsp. pastoris str. CCMP1986]
MSSFITPIIQINEACKYNNCILGYGHFNSIHTGHIRYLKRAKDINNILLVAVLKDPQFQGVIFTQEERAESIAQLGIANAIVLLPDNNLEKAVNIINPRELILGKEYENSNINNINTTVKNLKAKNKAIYFHAGEINYANTELLTISEDNLKKEREKEFLKALKRQNISCENLIETSKRIKNTKLIVIGDSIVDQYASCEALGMSAEAPVIVVKELEQKNFVGGAAIVASHITRLGSECEFISVIGSDEPGKWIHKELKKNSVKPNLFIDKNRPTTFKKRYIVENQKLFRVSRLEDHMIDKETTKKILDYVYKASLNANGIVISDFVYGIITGELLKGITKFANESGIKLYGDLQCSSQIGDISRMEDFTLICPNEREARISIQNKDIGLEELCRILISKTKCENLIMKLGANGFIVYSHQKGESPRVQAFPALSVNPVDVSGAGDTLLSIMAAGLSSGSKIMDVAALACCGSAIAVDTMGNNPIEIEKIIDKAIKIFNK